MVREEVNNESKQMILPINISKEKAVSLLHQQIETRITLITFCPYVAHFFACAVLHSKCVAGSVGAGRFLECTSFLCVFLVRT